MCGKNSFLIDNIVTQKNELENIFMSMCEYSLYSHIETLKQGYITLENGSRVGVCSSAVYENEKLVSVKDITSLNIRIPRLVKGFSKEVISSIFDKDISSIIVSGKPSSGKTTLLRDLAYELSNEKLKKVTLIDERNELAGKNNRVFSLDVGNNCDVITGFEKSKAIDIAIRTLSPEIIVCDEISTYEELEKIKFGFLSGTKFFLSIHSNDVYSLGKKKLFRDIYDLDEFEKVVFIEDDYKIKVYKIEEVLYENNWSPIYDIGIKSRGTFPCKTG